MSETVVCLYVYANQELDWQVHSTFIAEHKEKNNTFSEVKNKNFGVRAYRLVKRTYL